MFLSLDELDLSSKTPLYFLSFSILCIFSHLFLFRNLLHSWLASSPFILVLESLKLQSSPIFLVLELLSFVLKPW